MSSLTFLRAISGANVLYAGNSVKCDKGGGVGSLRKHSFSHLPRSLPRVAFVLIRIQFTQSKNRSGSDQLTCSNVRKSAYEEKGGGAKFCQKDDFVQK